MGGMGINNPAVQGAVTRAELFDGFNGQDVNAQLRNIINGISQGFYTQNSTMMGGFHGIESTLNQGFAGVDKSLCLGFNSKNDGLTQNRFDAQKCCCETNRNIDAIRFENSKNTTDIVNAIREDGNATRALINANEMQNLRDRVADKDRDLMAANFQISQQRQNDYLVNQIKPCAVPAYLTCSPYESAMVASRYYGCNGAY